MKVSKEIFNRINVSYFKNFTGKQSFEISISRVLKGIQSDYFKNLIVQVRKYRKTAPKESAKYKKKLHAVTFCGTFPEKRSVSTCTHYNNLLVIDIDDLKQEQMCGVTEYLKEDPYIAAFWQSPSGLGFKGLIHLSYDVEYNEMETIVKHKIAFHQIYIYLLSKYGIDLDRSGSDISRLCFMSWDSSLCLKNEALEFEVKPENIMSEENNTNHNQKMRQPLNQLDWNHILGLSGYFFNSEYRFQLNNIYKKLSKKGLSITDTYENWVKVAFAIAATIHPSKGRELFLKLCRLDGINHDEFKSEHLIFDAYSNNKGMVDFGTIIYLARQKGLNINS